MIVMIVSNHNTSVKIDCSTTSIALPGGAMQTNPITHIQKVLLAPVVALSAFSSIFCNIRIFNGGLGGDVSLKESTSS